MLRKPRDSLAPVELVEPMDVGGDALKNLELQSSSFRNFASHAGAHSLDVRTNMVLVALVAEKEVETWMQRRRKTFGRRGGFDAG